MKTPCWAVKCKAEVETKDGITQCGNILLVSEIPDPSNPQPLSPRTFGLTCPVCHQPRTYTEKDVFIHSPSQA